MRYTAIKPTPLGKWKLEPDALSISGAGSCAIETDWQNQFDGLRLLGRDYRRGGCRGEAFEHFDHHVAIFDINVAGRGEHNRQ